MLLILLLFLLFYYFRRLKAQNEALFEEAFLARLTPSLAHDINNPLMLLKYNVTLFRQMASNEKALSATQKQDESVEKINHISTLMQEYMRPSIESWAPIHDLLKCALVLVEKPSLRSNLFFETEFAPLNSTLKIKSVFFLRGFIFLLWSFKENKKNIDEKSFLKIKTFGQNDLFWIEITSSNTRPSETQSFYKHASNLLKKTNISLIAEEKFKIVLKFHS